MATEITLIDSDSHGTGIDPHTLSVSSSVQTGDLMIVCTSVSGGSASVSGGGAGSWTQFGGAGRQQLWWKRAPGNAPSDISVSGTQCSGVYAAFRGAREAGWIEALSTESGGSTTSRSQLAAPSQPRAWVVLVVSYSTNSSPNITAIDCANPNTLPEIAETHGGNGSQSVIALAAAKQDSQAATGTFSWAISGTGNNVEKSAFYLLPKVDLPAEPGAFTLTGTAAELIASGKIGAESGTLTLGFPVASLLIGGRLTRTRRGNPSWARDAHIGEVGGSVTKEDSKTEGREPYAAMLLREFHAMRGSLYTKSPNSLVHIENLMIARFMAAAFWRAPEKFRANLSPSRSDERLPYWVRFLGIPTQPREPKQIIRQRAAAHYRSSAGAGQQALREIVIDLLGEAFVDIVYTAGTSLSSPPAGTYWPGINYGPSSLDLGNGTWTSPRAHVVIQVTRPSGMTEGEYRNLVNVQLFQLLDRFLPATHTFAHVEV